jgi:hypothetical protein
MTEPDILGNLTFSPEPRFTLASLREIRIPAGDTRSSLCAYIFIKRGKRIEKIARLEDLSDKERAAALAFILHHGRTIIRRHSTPPSLDELPEFEPLPDPSAEEVLQTTENHATAPEAPEI